MSNKLKKYDGQVSANLIEHLEHVQLQEYNIAVIVILQP